MEVTVVITSHGDRDWFELGTRRAAQSAWAQGTPVVYVHGTSLHGARNAGLEQVETEHVVFLDADDELPDGYCAMLAAGTGDIRVPAVQYVPCGGRQRAPYIPRVAGHTHDCAAPCLSDGNWIVVGAMVRTQLVRDVGGWEPFQWSEDWALWARCYRAGAVIERYPDAHYIAHVRANSRNRSASPEIRAAAHRDIHRAVWPELHEETTQ